jgi:hypothetical protein
LVRLVRLAIRAVIVLNLFVLLPMIIWHPGRPGHWVEAGDHAGCTVVNWYGGRRWNRAATTTVTWSGPCVDGHAEGRGILEWRRDRTITIHYEGDMAAGDLAGHGVLITAAGIRYEADWHAGKMDHGTATYPDGRRFEGDWYQNGWSRGILSMSGGHRLEGSWYEGRLDGKGIAAGPEGRYEGDWARGRPDGAGILVTASGQRLAGNWRDGKFVDHGEGRLVDDRLWASGLVKNGDRHASPTGPLETGLRLW